MKFKIKEGHPKMAVIYEGKKYILSEIKEIPDGMYKAIGGRKNIYGIIKEKENGNSNSS